MFLFHDKSTKYILKRRVQPHLKKCFEGIAKLTFTEDLDVTEMKSSEGEIVPLVDVIQTALARGQVEKWLVELEADMKKSVHNMVAESIKDYPARPRDQWVLKWPGQCIQSISCTFWTVEVTAAIKQGLNSMKTYLEKCNWQIAKIVDLVRGKLNAQNRITLGKKGSPEATSFMTIIAIHEIITCRCFDSLDWLNLKILCLWLLILLLLIYLIFNHIFLLPKKMYEYVSYIKMKCFILILLHQQE